MSDIDLFGDDFVERRKRDTNTTDYEDYDVNDLDWEYYEYYYGEDEDYEVEVGGKIFYLFFIFLTPWFLVNPVFSCNFSDYENEFDASYPDYVPPPGFGNGIQVNTICC